MDPRLFPYFVYPKRRAYPHYDRRIMYKPRHRYEYRIPFPLASHMKYDLGYRGTRHQTQSLNLERFIPEMLKLHNQYRAHHCSPPLKLDQRLNEIAQSYAEHLASTSTFEHSGNKLGDEALGENLYMEWISQGPVTTSAKAAMKSWYDEIAMHNFNKPKFSKETGHFTQLVWRSTRKLGVGIAFSHDKREVYIVTNYYPAGNIVSPGYFEKNVLPPNC